MKKTKNNNIKNTLNRELGSIKLSEQAKRDILYNAQHADRRTGKKPATYAMWAAAAMIVILGASLIASGSRVLPDLQRQQPLSPGSGIPTQSSAALTKGENEACSAITKDPDIEPTAVPAVMNDLFLRYDHEEIRPVSNGEQMLWGTKNGTYYHLVSDCSGMKNAVQMSRSEVNASGKMPCPVCIAFVTPTPIPAELQVTPNPTPTPAEPQVTPEPTSTPMTTKSPACDTGSSAEQPYFGTEHGTFYHITQDCSGMENAEWLTDLTGKQPCPLCIPHATISPVPVRSTPEPSPTPMPAPIFWGTEHGVFYHITQNCSGMENAEWLTDLTGKQPCPLCIAAITVSATEIPEAVYGAQAEAGESTFPDEISLVRYTLEDACIMELEYDYDREFSLIDKPADLESWYVDEADADRFGTGGYLAGLIAPEDIDTFENSCIQNGEAGFEIRDMVVFLDDVKTQTSTSVEDLPSGVEYRFTGTEQPGKCILYSLDRPIEGDTAEIVVAERLHRYWFDGEKYYRALVDGSTNVRYANVFIRDAGEAAAYQEPLFFNFDGELTILTLEDAQYVIAVANDDGNLSRSALITEDGSPFVPDMVINQTFHADEIAGWRYAAEDANKFEFIRLSDGSCASEVHPDIPGSGSASVLESLSLLLTSCGVTDPDAVQRTANTLIVLSENGDITAIASQPVLNTLLETGLSGEEIAKAGLVSEIIAILDDAG